VILFPIKTTDVKVGIPYAREERPNGTNHGYIDLKDPSQAVDRIPEPLGFKEFKDLVTVAGGPDSVFHTIGCYTKSGESQRPEYTRRFKSYLGVVFEVLQLNRTVRPFELLYHRFRQFFNEVADPADSYGVEFSIGLTKFDEHGGVLGHHVAIKNFGWGNTDADARDRWEQGIRVVRQFFVRENAALPRPLPTETTVSRYGVRRTQ